MENKAGGGCRESLSSPSDWANSGTIYQGGEQLGGVALGKKIESESEQVESNMPVRALAGAVPLGHASGGRGAADTPSPGTAPSE